MGRSFQRKKAAAAVTAIMLSICILGSSGQVHAEDEAPGKVDKGSICAADITSSSAVISWDAAENAVSYVLYYMKDGAESWSKKKTVKCRVKLTGLSAVKKYSVKVRSVNGTKRATSGAVSFKTAKKDQKITVSAPLFSKRVYKSFSIGAKAKGALSYMTSSSDIADVTPEGKVTITGIGSATVTVTAAATKTYKAAEKKISITGTEKLLGTLTSSNCNKMLGVKGINGATTPQSFCFTGTSYVVAFQAGSAENQYLKEYLVPEDVTRNESKESKKELVDHIEEPLELGHANGMTFSTDTDLIYSVSGSGNGNTTARGKTCERFNTSLGQIEAITDLNHSTSGIAFDRDRKAFYLSSAGTAGKKGYVYIFRDSSHVWADSVFKGKESSKVQKVRPQITSGVSKLSNQDVGGFKGYAYVGVSLGETAAAKKLNNYVDKYNVKNGKYAGSYKVEMGEVESIDFDNDGYMVLLVNSTGTTDYIWRTNIEL